MTWYNKKQLTLAFQGHDGSFLKSKLVDVVSNKKARADSSVLDVSTTTEQEKTKNQNLTELERKLTIVAPFGVAPT